MPQLKSLLVQAHSIGNMSSEIQKAQEKFLSIESAIEAIEEGDCAMVILRYALGAYRDSGEEPPKKLAFICQKLKLDPEALAE